MADGRSTGSAPYTEVSFLYLYKLNLYAIAVG